MEMGQNNSGTSKQLGIKKFSMMYGGFNFGSSKLKFKAKGLKQNARQPTFFKPNKLKSNPKQVK